MVKHLKAIAKISATYFLTTFSLFIAIGSGTFLMKIKAAFKLSLYLSPIAIIMQDTHLWYLDNSEYVNIVFFAILIDYVLGTVKHLFWLRDWSFKLNISGLLVKSGLVLGVGYLFEALEVLLREESTVAGYVGLIASLIVFLYPAGSAFSSSSIISGGKFPPLGWLLLLQRFKENIDPSVFGAKNLADIEDVKAAHEEAIENLKNNNI